MAGFIALVIARNPPPAGGVVARVYVTTSQFVTENGKTYAASGAVKEG